MADPHGRLIHMDVENKTLCVDECWFPMKHLPARFLTSINETFNLDGACYLGSASPDGSER